MADTRHYARPGGGTSRRGKLPVRKKLSRLIEPNIQPCFLCLILFIIAAVPVQPWLAVVEAAVKDHVLGVGLSALMTTTVPSMEETIRQLREQAPWVKVMVGGAVLTKEYADTIGADRYCRDAMASVDFAGEVMAGGI